MDHGVSWYGMCTLLLPLIDNWIVWLSCMLIRYRSLREVSFLAKDESPLRLHVEDLAPLTNVIRTNATCKAYTGLDRLLSMIVLITRTGLIRYEELFGT